MRPFDAKQVTTRARQKAGPSEELRIAVTFRGARDQVGLTKVAARLSSASVSDMAPDSLGVDQALHELGRRGFEITRRGRMAVSIRGSRQLFERTFGTRLQRVDLEKTQACSQYSFYYPPSGAAWAPDAGLAGLIDDAYIQWPHIYMAAKAKKTPTPSDRPPDVPYYHLDVLTGVVRHINATPVHAQGTTGKGVRVVMVDSGFAHSHSFFKRHEFRSSVVLAPGATHRTTDQNGHGTGESANVFSIAPGATFIGVKVDNDDDPNAGASMLEGFQEAMQHKPQVISISMGYDLRRQAPGKPMGVQLEALPNGLKALEAEIQAAIADGVVVVFSAGNGHYSFPGSMREVISAGGVYVAEDGSLRASDYASAFPSRIYPGRNVPDFCGLVGLLPHADYIMLPIPAGCEIDLDNASHDQTAARDGWGVFSGTSAAAPQLAAVCALLLEKNAGLKPAEVKAVLTRTSRDVTNGRANPASDEAAGTGIAAGPGADGATGAGLVDAFAAWQQV